VCGAYGERFDPADPGHCSVSVNVGTKARPPVRSPKHDRPWLTREQPRDRHPKRRDDPDRL
jgi:hypothetical protein